MAVAQPAICQSPTDAELIFWWQSLTVDERVETLRKLDDIEHATPVIDMPQLLILVLDDGTVTARHDRNLTISIADELEYSIAMPRATAQLPPFRNHWLWFGIGATSASAIAILAWSITH